MRDVQVRVKVPIATPQDYTFNVPVIRNGSGNGDFEIPYTGEKKAEDAACLIESFKEVA